MPGSTLKLKYSELEKLLWVVRALRYSGRKVNGSMGMHVYVGRKNHTPQSLRNLLSTMYSKEDILFRALGVQDSREERWCRKVRESMLLKTGKLPKNATMSQLENIWYNGRVYHQHYHDSRYHAVNLHAMFTKKTVEFRCFESTLDSGDVKANVVLVLAISAQAVNQKTAQMKKTEIHENPCFTFRTYLLRLGMIGSEYKIVRERLLARLEGGKAWWYDKFQYECLQNRNNRRGTAQ